MSSLNQCNFIGHLGRDPETRTFNNGGKVCNLRLACTETWKKDGERQERTEWVSVAIFSDGLAGVAERYLRKGSKVYISGKMQTRKWQDQSGADRYSTEIVLQGPAAQLVLLDSKGGGQDRQQSHDGYGAGGNANAGRDMDDEIPFAPETRA